MGKALALLLGVSFTLSGCGAPADRPRSDPPPGGSESTGGANAEQRSVAIYAAVVRQLVTKDHTFGSEPAPFERVFIVDGVVEDAARSRAPRPVPEPFPPAVKSAILRELADLPPVRFVSDPDSVIVGNECPHVRADGVLITLGPIEGKENRVRVANGLYFACLGGQWLTYVLERADGTWRIVGTTGPVAIS